MTDVLRTRFYSLGSNLLIWASRFAKRPLLVRQHGRWFAVARDSRGVPHAGTGPTQMAAREDIAGLIAAVEKVYTDA